MWDTLYVCDLILSSNILFIKEKEKNLRFTLSNNNYDSRKPHFTDANPGKYLVQLNLSDAHLINKIIKQYR